MLCGSGSAEVKKLGFHRLSTFGLLSHLKQDEVLVIIDALMAVRCVQQVDVDRFRPVLELTEFGGDVMRGKAPLSGELPLPADLQRKLRAEVRKEGERGTGGDEETEHADSPASDVSPDPDLLKALKHWRAKSGTKPACRSTAYSAMPCLMN